MKWRLPLVTFIIVILVTLFIAPTMLFGQIICAGEYTYFTFYYEWHEQSGYSLIYIICPVNDCEDCTAEFANDALGFDVYAQGSDPLEPGDNEWTEGVKIMEPDTYCLWFATIPTPNDLTEIDLTEINWVGGACFEVKECKEPKEEPETKVLERNHEMECFKVWVNEDNNFEFVFWWEYKDNNHVQIFDMAGNLVWEIDFEKGEPRFVAELPDGMYTVKTFHEAGHILQEFVIGKP